MLELLRCSLAVAAPTHTGAILEDAECYVVSLSGITLDRRVTFGPI